MSDPTIFDRLCDLTDELGRIEHRMPHSELQCALAALVERFDDLIDSTVGLEATQIETAEEELAE